MSATATNAREVHQLHYSGVIVEVSIDAEGNLSVNFIGDASFDLKEFRAVAEFVEGVAGLDSPGV